MLRKAKNGEEQINQNIFPGVKKCQSSHFIDCHVAMWHEITEMNIIHLSIYSGAFYFYKNDAINTLIVVWNWKWIIRVNQVTFFQLIYPCILFARSLKVVHRNGESSNADNINNKVLTVEPLGVVFERSLETMFLSSRRHVKDVCSEQHGVSFREFSICTWILLLSMIEWKEI